MVVENRYMRSDVTESYYNLWNTNTTSAISVTIAGEGPSGTIVYVGVRVYIQHADDSKTEVTSGSAVAVISQGTGVSQFTTLSATWACPLTSLVVTDKILVEVYGQLNVTLPTTLLRSFITGALNAVQLDAVTWTVAYRLQRIRYGTSPNYLYYWKWWHGSSVDNSYILNFTWTGVEPTAKSFSDVGGGSDAFINPYRAMPFSDAGHGTEAFNTPFRTMGFADVGSGADVFTNEILGAILKAFSDAGYGSDVFNIPFRTMGFSDVGHGTDAFLIIFKTVFFSDVGWGSDSFEKYIPSVVGMPMVLIIEPITINLKTGEIMVITEKILIVGPIVINLKTGEIMVAI